MKSGVAIHHDLLYELVNLLAGHVTDPGVDCLRLLLGLIKVDWADVRVENVVKTLPVTCEQVKVLHCEGLIGRLQSTH